MIGTLYGGRFRILDQLGSGGMGTVYRAEQVALRRDVALKLMHPYLAQAPGQAERFHREAHVLAKLHHKNSVEVYDVGEAEGTLFIAMELLAGNGLDDLLRAGGPMQPQRAIAITAQVLDALAAAHELGVVHRDLKPANIFMVARKKKPAARKAGLDAFTGVGLGPKGPARGVDLFSQAFQVSSGELPAVGQAAALEAEETGDQVKVLDFGLAFLREEQGGRITRQGQTAGTPAYMSPEQCRGEQVDGRADLYALGCTLYEMLAGTPPYGWGETNAVEVMAAQLYQPVPKMSAQRWDLAIPEPVEVAVLRALAKRPEERWPDAKAMRDGLFAALARAAEPDAAREDKHEVRPAEVVLPPSRVESDRPVGLAGVELAQVATALGAAGLTVRELPAPPSSGQMPQLAGLGALVVAAAAGTSAFALAERFAALAEAPPVLLCGPEDDLQEMAQAIAAGIFDYVPLPLDPADLSRKVARALRQRR